MGEVNCWLIKSGGDSQVYDFIIGRALDRNLESLLDFVQTTR